MQKREGIDNPNFFYPAEIDLSNQAFTSPFCHIEGTIGLLNDLPLLIINEEGVREEGIIKGGRFCVKTAKFNLNDIESFFSNRTFEQQLLIWVGKVTDYYLFLRQHRINHNSGRNDKEKVSTIQRRHINISNYQSQGALNQTVRFFLSARYRFATANII